VTPPEQVQSWQQQHGSNSSSSGGGVWSAHSGKKRRVLHAYSPEDCAKLGALYRELCEAYPKSLACHRMPLDFLVGD
jgi:N-acetyl-anhydromuramyl-L-alanine amidase AmpD